MILRSAPSEIRSDKALANITMMSPLLLYCMREINNTKELKPRKSPHASCLKGQVSSNTTRHLKGKNIYTQPLQGAPYYRNSGIIYAVDRSGNKYAVGRVDLERFDDQNFQYVFTPDWDVIDSLPTSIFQGIHGLDMSLRLERYYRVNMTPYFISERTPSEKREDLWELLEEVGLDYYDRFEWLLRTNMRCGTDNLIVERAEAVQD